MTKQPSMPNRPDKHTPDSLAFATQAVHAGNAVDSGSGGCARRS